jgi:hypothetical protein
VVENDAVVNRKSQRKVFEVERERWLIVLLFFDYGPGRSYVFIRLSREKIEMSKALRSVSYENLVKIPDAGGDLQLALDACIGCAGNPA